jgi:hypothetical protein
LPKLLYRQRISPPLLPKLLYSDAIGDARVSKIGPNEAVDTAVKGIAAGLHAEFHPRVDEEDRTLANHRRLDS